MKKMMIVVVVMIVMMMIVACDKQEVNEVKVTIPAGSTEAYVYSEQQICPTKDHIKVATGEGLSDTQVIFETVEVNDKKITEPTSLSVGTAEKIEVEQGKWLKVGVAMRNPSNEDRIVSVKMENVEVKAE